MNEPSPMYFLKNILVFLASILIIKHITLVFVEYWTLPFFLLAIVNWIISLIISEKFYPLGEHGLAYLFMKNKE
jgi:hypothetical protein